MVEKSKDKIKRLLDEFVAGGGNVDDLGRDDSLYRYILFANITDEEDRKLSLEEKFAMAGHPRERKHVKSAEEELCLQAQAWLDAGNDFHVKRRSLPFYELLHTVVKNVKNKSGKDVSYEEVMKNLGFKNYSDTYFRFSKVLDLENYKDESGFVDGYKKDSQMKGYINSVAETLNIPIAIVVGLIGNQNLKRYSLDVDYFKALKDELQKYIDTYGSLKDIKRNNKRLYEKFWETKSRVYGPDGETLTSQQFATALGLDAENSFYDLIKRDRQGNDADVNEIMHMLYEKSLSQDGKIYMRDIPPKWYRAIVDKSMQMGCYTNAMFSMYDMDYVDASENLRFKRMLVEKYPCMKEMRELRDEIYNASISENGGEKCKEELFEIYLNSCIQVYNKYKGVIHNFDISDVEIEEDSKE